MRLKLLAALAAVLVSVTLFVKWQFDNDMQRARAHAARGSVLLLLHLLPRFTGAPPVPHTVADLNGRAATEFAQFVAAHRDELLTPSVRP